jgi:hypothetical protein
VAELALSAGAFQFAWHPLSFFFGWPVVSPASLKNPNPTGFQWVVTDYLFSESFSPPVCRPALISEIVR